MRRTIAAHMVQSVATAPHVTSVFEADLSAVVAHREANKAAFAAGGAKLTYTAYFVRAMVDAVRAVPEANAAGTTTRSRSGTMSTSGVATALGSEGLIVPVVRQAQTLDLAGTARAAARPHRAGPSRRAHAEGRAGRHHHHLQPRRERQPARGADHHSTSPSRPSWASASWSSGRWRARAAPSGRARPMCYVTLTIDHRVLDGFQANAFLARWVEAIEGWR